MFAVNDPNGGSTLYMYDANNRVTQQIRPMLQAVAYEYDAVGNRTAVFDANAQKKFTNTMR